MSAMTPAQRNAHRRFYRTSVEVPTKLWDDLQAALRRRADQLKSQHGVEINGSFTAWLREKAEETIEQYKK
jgi:hypothetical protein